MGFSGRRGLQSRLIGGAEKEWKEDARARPDLNEALPHRRYKEGLWGTAGK